jgi:hypothetical protein
MNLEICNEPTEIHGSPDEFAISEPYKYTKDAWKINIINKNNKVKYTISKSTREEVESFLFQNCVKISFFLINITDGNGLFLRTEYFDNLADCNNYILINNIEQKKIIENNSIKSIEHSNGFLEKFLKDGAEEEDKIVADEIARLKEEKDIIKTEYDDRERKFMVSAKQLLLSVVKFYFKNEKISNEEYVKYKFNIESTTLSNLMSQLDIAKRVVYKLYERIETDENASVATFSALTQAQNFAFTIGKYQHEYMQSLEKSVKSLKTDVEEHNPGLVEDFTQFTEVKGDDLQTKFNNQALLTTKLNEFIKKSKEVKIPKSANVKLHDNDPNVGEEVKLHDPEDNMNQKDSEHESTGLETWTD